jgi:hypothetical protein
LVSSLQRLLKELMMVPLNQLSLPEDLK